MDGAPGDGSWPPEITISLLDQTNGQVFESTRPTPPAPMPSMGSCAGNYTIQTPDGTVVETPIVVLEVGEDLELNLVLYDSMRLSGVVSYDGQVVSNAMVGLTGDTGVVWVKSDSRGRYSAVVPQGDVTVYATATVNGVEVVYLDLVQATDSLTLNPQLGPAAILEGTVLYSGSAVSGATVHLESSATGAVYNAVTNTSGGFRAVLPSDQYFGYMYYLTRSYWGDINLNSSVIVDLQPDLLGHHIRHRLV